MFLKQASGQKGLSSTKIAQNSHSAFSLNCNGLGLHLCPSSTRRHFHFIFLDSTRKPVVYVSKFPKHAFLSHSPKAPSWGLSTDQSSGRSRFCFKKETRWANRGAESVESQDDTKFSVSVSATVPIREGTRERIVDTMVLHPPETAVASSPVRKVVVTVVVVGKQAREFSPVPIPSSLLQRSSLCQVINTEPHQQISVDTFVACALHRMAL